MSGGSASMKPMKYALPRPGTISPAGEFQLKNPMAAPIMNSDAGSTDWVRCLKRDIHDIHERRELRRFDPTGSSRPSDVP